MATRKKQPYGQPYVYRVLFGPGEREEMYVEAEDLGLSVS